MRSVPDYWKKYYNTIEWILDLPNSLIWLVISLSLSLSLSLSSSYTLLSDWLQIEVYSRLCMYLGYEVSRFGIEDNIRIRIGSYTARATKPTYVR